MPYVPITHHQGKPQESGPRICSNVIKRSQPSGTSLKPPRRPAEILPKGIVASSYSSSWQGNNRSRAYQGGAGRGGL